VFVNVPRRRSIEAQLTDRQPGHVTHDGYRRGRAGGAPVITKLGRNGVILRPDLAAKSEDHVLKFETQDT
jgi:hypothetical protein